MMKRQIKHKKISAAALVSVALLSSPTARATIADGIVDEWTISVGAVFDTPVFGTTNNNTNINYSYLPPSFLPGQTQLRWGTPINDQNNEFLDGPSGLDINNPSNNPIPHILTNGPQVPNVGVTHLNHIITAAEDSLDKVNILATLTLTPFDPALDATGTPLFPATITFVIEFQETRNAGELVNGVETGVCKQGGAPQGAGCPDIFVIDKTALNFPFLYDRSGTDLLPPQLYYISFFEATNGLNSLPAAACTAAGATAPCLGFITQENADTSVLFAALITTEKVEIGCPNGDCDIPEPGTMALVGIALGALGLSRRLFG